MEAEANNTLGSLLKILPPVDFCCVYGSSLHPNNNDKSSMEDYILGVSDPHQWHSENLKINQDHYASWIIRLGGTRLINEVADRIGVGVHFNPFVSWNNRVCTIVDNKEIKNFNLANLKAASSAALLLLPPKFTEVELYAKICSLSYMGDLRMLFAEDKNKVKKIVQGQFELFRRMYKPLLEEYATKELLRFSSPGDYPINISQDCSLAATSSIVSSLPAPVRSQMRMGLPKKPTGEVTTQLAIGSRDEAAKSVQKVLRRKVMISSARQAVAGFLTVGAVHGARYLGNKVKKAWRSWTD